MTSARDRLFYSIPKCGQLEDIEPKKDDSKLLTYIRNNIIGQRKQFSGPFGLREALYLDYTASGKSLRFIEDYIQEQVLPEYGNTHTTSSVTSLQTTLYRHEARDIVRNAVHASEHDAVIFVGSGSTAAVHKLIHALDLKTSPVVIVGPYEHHSNLLPWKEIGAKVLRVRADAEGLVDQDHLLHLLKKWKASSRQLIGCFSAASNITGILVDVDAINILLHKHGALAFWDFATAAPYVQIDMNPVSASADQPYMYKDAVFISCHKFVGGVQTPGILIAKKTLFRNGTPGGCGGGSVFFVRRDDHRYLQEPELKEEGGTPAIIESIRAGLVFQLKQAVSPSVIMEREDYLLKRAVEAWKDHPSLILLGNTEVPRLPIFSFLVYHKESGRFLHHNFVSVLLNDLFGIQARGGCACAGPYAMDLLGMEEDMSRQIESMLAEDSRLDRTHLRRYREYSQREILRPGFTRINLPYFMDDETLEFVLEAVKIVAEEGWKLLPQYMFNPETGEWRQVSFQVFKDRKWLGHISYSSGEMAYKIPQPVNKGPLPDSYKDCLQKARDLCLRSSKSRYQLADHTVMFDEDTRKYRWFVLPSEASQCLKENKVPVDGNLLPFCPPSLRETIGLPAFVIDDADVENVNDVTDFIDQSDVENIHRNDGNMKHSTSTVDIDSLKSFSEGFSECLERGFQGKDTEACTMGTICDVKEDLKTDCNDSANDIIMSAKGPGIQKDDSDTIKCNKSISDLSKTVSSKRDNLDSLGCNDVTEMSNGVLTDECGNSGKKTATSNNKTGLVEPGETSVLDSSSEVDSDIYEYTSSLNTNEKTNSLNVEENTSSLNRKENINSFDRNETTNSLNTKENTNSLNTKENTNSLKTEENTDSLHRQENTNGLNTCQLSGSVNTIEENQTTVISGEAGENKERMCRKRHVGQNSPGEDNQVKKIKENGEGKVSDKQVKEIISSQGMSNGTVKKKRKENKWCSPPKTIFTPFLKATEEFNMIQDGDCVLVCLSGGKDSLSLLHTVHQYKYCCRKKNITFALGAVTVDPQTPSYDPSPLKLYLASLGVPYFYESQGILEQASNLPYECASICSFCSRMKRGRIYACARREGYNVLALGQHLDDLCESFMMSVFHNGNLRTMKAHYTVEEGDLRVIRPFVYVREKDLRTFAEQNKLPVIAENCPACFEAPKERHRIKQLLAAQEIMFPRIYPSMLSAIKPIMAISKTQIKLADMINHTEDETVDDIDI